MNYSTKKNKKLYNPNRFNGLDSAICFICLLCVFLVAPYGVKIFLGDTLSRLKDFDTYAFLIVNGLIYQVLIFLVAFIFSLVRRVNPFNGGGYKAGFDGVQVLMSIVLIMGIMMLFYYTHLQFSNSSNTIFVVSADDVKLSNYSLIFVFVYVLEISILPAFIEEMAFRGIIMRGMEQFGLIFAVVLSSCAFALMHGNLSQLILQFIGGLAIGGVVVITKNWLLGSIMHFSNNAFSIVYSFLITPLLKNPVYENITTVSKMVSIVLGIIFVLIGVIYFVSMLFEKEKNKVLGKTTENKFEKKKYYLAYDLNGEIFINAKIPAVMKDASQEDERRFYFFGKYRPLNKKSKSVKTFILYGVGIILAIISFFL